MAIGKQGSVVAFLETFVEKRDYLETEKVSVGCPCDHDPVKGQLG